MNPLEGHLEKLPQFIAIAESHSIAKAAKKLRLTQPALSHTIQVLEATIGTKLFVRTSRGIILTEAGTELLSFSRTLLQSVENFQTEFRLKDSLIHPSITVGTKEPLAINLWPHYLRNFHQNKFPTQIHLQIKRTNDELVRLLSKHQLDLLLIPDPPVDQEIRAIELYKESYGVFATPAASKNSGLKIFTFMSAMAARGKSIQSLLNREPKEVQSSVADVDSFGVAKALMLQGLGGALLPMSMVRTELKKKQVVPYFPPQFSPSIFGALSICICVHERNAQKKVLKSFIRTLKETHRILFP